MVKDMCYEDTYKALERLAPNYANGLITGLEIASKGQFSSCLSDEYGEWQLRVALPAMRRCLQDMQEDEETFFVILRGKALRRLGY